MFQTLQIQVTHNRAAGTKPAITGLAYWQRGPDDTSEPHFLPPAIIQNPLIAALAGEAVALFIGGDDPAQALAPGWYPASADLVEAVEMYQRLRSIGGTLGFSEVCNLLPRNELARLIQACEVMAIWASGNAHIYTVASACAIVKTAAARRGLI